MSNDKEKILKNFDDLAVAKKRSSAALKLIIGFSAFVVVAVLIFSFSLVIAGMDKIKVVDRSGGYLKTDLVRKEKLFQSLIQNQCANAVYYANSFDRLTIKENQAKAMFLINADDCNRLFATYKDNKGYTDALNRGVIYTAVFEKLESISGTEEPYHVVFSAILTIQDNDRPITRFKLKCEGDIIEYTPQFPETTSGYYFKKYSQSYEKSESDGNGQN